MTTRLKLKPGSKGTKKLVAKYGDSLVCVRYRYDEASRKRIKTVELVIEEVDWTPPPPKFLADMLVAVQIAYTENRLNCQRCRWKMGSKYKGMACALQKSQRHPAGKAYIIRCRAK